MRAAVSSDESGFIVCDATDIKRLSFHLVTHRTLPRVRFRMDGLPSLASQRAQDRFSRLYNGCNCVLGEVLGAATVLGGILVVWASSESWSGLAWVVAAAVCAALIGKVVELAWVRLKLLLVLRGLWRRIAAGEESGEDSAVIPVAVQPSRRAWSPADDLAEKRSPIQSVIRKGPRRPRVILGDTADIDRLVPGLATRWALPRIEIRADALPLLDVQRAQLRIVRFSGPFSYFPAALLGMAILLGGLLYVVWTESQAWASSQRDDWWLQKLDWSDVQPVVIAALCAGLVGTAIEAIWMRFRLLQVLRELRRRLEQAADT